ncbi:MAG: hypothetical protein ACXVIJ_05435 [Thermoanaerobaculia bacterium]
MKIVAAQPLKKQTLEVHDHGITYSEGTGFGMGEVSNFSFDQIDAVVRSATDPVLSIQIGTTIYKLAVRKDPAHDAVIAQIVAGAEKTVVPAGGSDVTQSQD